MSDNNKKKVALKKTPGKGSSKKAKEKNNPLVDISVRKEFYKDQASSMTKMAVVSIGCFALASGLVAWSVGKEPSKVYIAVNEDKTLTKLIPLSQPNHKDAVVSNWLARALVDTFDFSYFNIKSHLNEATMNWFTDNGRSELLNALKESGNFDAIIERRMIVGLSVDAVPLVLKKAKPDFSNSYLWKLEVPATITFRTEAKEYTNKVLFTVTVARQSLLSNAEGLGIHRIVMERVK